MAGRAGVRTPPVVIQQVKRLWWQGYSLEKIASLPNIPVTKRIIHRWIKDFKWREELEEVESRVTEDLRAELYEFHLDLRNNNRLRLQKMGAIIDVLLDKGVIETGEEIKNAKALMQTLRDLFRTQRILTADKEVKEEVNTQILSIENLLIQVGEHQSNEEYKHPREVASTVRPALPQESESMGH